MMHRDRDFSKLREHYKSYRRRRAISRKWALFTRFIKKWLGWLSYLRYLNPFRYLKRLDR